MGFFSFSLSYYKNELHKLELTPATTSTIYKAKQLLKLLDDLEFEGYTQLNEMIENDFNGISRLKSYLNKNNVQPFSINPNRLKLYKPTYGQPEIELDNAISLLVRDAERCQSTSDDKFLN
ncbi:MAG: hypothetical protein ACI4MN_03805 [Candidatus Coproplasma sp.]